MKVVLIKTLPKKRAMLQSTARSLIHGLANLALFQLRTGHVPTLDQLLKMLATFDELCESCKNGDRVQCRLCKNAEAELSEALVTVIRFLESVAHEDDIPALLQAGLQLAKPTSRKKTSKPAPAPVKQ